MRFSDFFSTDTFINANKCNKITHNLHTVMMSSAIAAAAVTAWWMKNHIKCYRIYIYSMYIWIVVLNVWSTYFLHCQQTTYWERNAWMPCNIKITLKNLIKCFYPFLFLVRERERVYVEQKPTEWSVVLATYSFHCI